VTDLYPQPPASPAARGAGGVCRPVRPFHRLPALLAVLLGAASLAVAALPGRTGTLEPATVKETVFPSGLRLLVKEAHATELAAIQVWIRVGGFREDATTSGTAHVIEHLVFKGSDTRGPGALDSEVENVGGLLEASTEKDWTRFGCTVAGRYAGRVLGAMAEAIRKPQFRAEDFAAEKPLIQEEIDQIRLNPEAAVSVGLYQLAFQHHPYRYDVRGTPNFLNKLDLAAVKAFYQKQYTPANMTVVVVGDVDAAAVEKAVRADFQADAPAAKETAPLPEPEKACSKPGRSVIETGFNTGFVGLAYPAPSVKDEPDVYAMDILLTMLETDGVGRLPRLLKGAAVADATYETRRQAGLFTIIAATGPANAEGVEAAIRKEVDFIRSHPIPADELNYAKRALRGTYALDNEPYAGQAASLGYYDAIDRWQFATDYLAKVDAVTPEQLQAVAEKYLRDDQTVAVILKPRGSGPTEPPKVGA
jgi:zinc protease